MSSAGDDARGGGPNTVYPSSDSLTVMNLPISVDVSVDLESSGTEIRAPLSAPTIHMSAFLIADHTWT